MNTNKIKNLARNATKSKDGRTVLSNFGYLTLLQFASYLFPIITVDYRYYYRQGAENVIAVQLGAGYASGRMPLSQRFSMGGSETLRSCS